MSKINFKNLTILRFFIAFFLCGLFFVFPSFASAADRYWVGGTGNWSDATNHWATSTGGTPGAGNLPTVADNAIFNSASNATAYTVTIDSIANIKDLTIGNPASGVITLAGNAALTIGGNATFASGMTNNYTGAINFTSVFYKNVSAQEALPYGVTFSSDGTKMYVVGTGSIKVYQYNLAVAWDVSTASYSSLFKDVSAQDIHPTTIAFNSDGTKMYIVGVNNDIIYQYTMGVAWDVSTASYASISKNVATEDGYPCGVTFSSDGTKMYVTGNDSDNIYQYALSTAWDVSTATYASLYKNVTTQDSSPYNITFSSDGTKMYMVGSDSSTTYQYTLSTAWDISTATYASISKYSYIREITFNPDGTKMYVVMASDNTIYQYTLSVAWNISTASFSGPTKTITTNGVALASALTFDSLGDTTWQLQDALSTTGSITLTNGTLDTNNQSVSSLTFATAAGTKTLNLGSTTWTLTGNNTTIWNWSTTNATMNGSGGTIVSNYSGSTGTRTIAMGAATGNPNLSITAGTDIIVTSAATLNSLNFTGFAGTWSASSGALSLYGNLTLASGMTNSNTAGLTFSSTSSVKTITTNGKTLNSTINFNGVGGSWQLQDNLTTIGLGLTLTNGTFDPNGKTVSMIGTGAAVVTGSFSFYNFTRIGTAAETDELNFGSNVTITNTLTLTGNNTTNKITVKSNTAGTRRIITAAFVSLSDVRFRDIDANGASIPWTGTRLIDYGNNLDITFSSVAYRYWVGGTGNWSDAANHWATSSGGTPGAGNLPSSSDDYAIFDSSSNANAYTVTIDSAAHCNSLTIGNPASGVITLAGSATISIGGNATFASGMTNNYTGAITFNALHPGSKTINMNSVSLASAVTFDAAGVTWQLQDALSTTGAITLANGTLDTNNQSVSSLTFATATGTKTLNLGSTTWTLTGNNATIWNWSITNATMNGSGGTIAANYSGSTGTRTITMGAATGNPNLSITAGTDIIVTSAATLNSLNFTGFAGTWSASSGALSLYGNLTLVSGMTNSNTAGLTFASTSSVKTITTNGKTLNSTINFNGVGGSWQLQDALSTTGGISLFNGTLDTNSQSVSSSTFASYYAVKVLKLGSTTWTITGNNTTIWSWSASLSTVIGSDATIISNYSGSTGTRTIAMGSATGNPNLSITAGTDIIVTSAATLNSLNFTGFAGTWSASSGALSLYGNLTLASGMTNSNTAGLTFASTSAKSDAEMEAYITNAGFNSDGTKMYLVGNGNNKVYQYALATAWDVSTAYYDSLSKDVTTEDLYPYGITFNSDGTKMYIMGNYTDTVYQYTLATAWDVSTASYASLSKSVTAQESSPCDVIFNSDGSKMYIMGQTNDTVYQYTLGTAWDVSTASYASLSKSVAAQDSGPWGLTFKSDGTKMYVSGETSNNVYQYTLGTAWDVSSASYDSISKSVVAEDTLNTGINFNSDGTKMYMVGAQSDTVYQYTLGTAWDISTASVSTIATKSITTNNIELKSSLTFNGAGGSWQLQDNLTTTGLGFILTRGTFDPNGKNVSMTGAGAVAVTGSLSFYNFTRIGTAAETDELNFGSDVTIANTLTLTGNSNLNKLLVRSNTTGTQRIITAAVVSLADVRFRDIDANGASVTWTGTRLIDYGNNLDISFASAIYRYWVGGTGNWSDATNHWATSSGGTPGAGNLPSSSDDYAIFDSSSNATAYMVTIDSAVHCNSLTIGNPASGVITLAGSATLSIGGSVTFASGMTNNYTGNIIFNALHASSKTITMNGVALASAITFNAAGVTWQLQDALSTTGAITLTNGTLDTNSQSVSSLTFATATGTKTLNLGSTTWTLTGNNTTIWNWSITDATMLGSGGTIVANYSGSTGTRTITMGAATGNPNLSITAGTDIIITSAATLNSLNFTGFAGTWSASSGALSLYGNLTLASGMTNSNTAALTFVATSIKNIVSQETAPMGHKFNSDGTKMYILGSANDTIYQYTLGTAWDVSTATYASLSKSIAAQEDYPTDMTFNSDGTKMYIVGTTNDTVYQYTLSTAWDVSSASYDSISKSVLAQGSDPKGITFNSDGSKMYILGDTNDAVYQYTLGTSWDVSTASYASLYISVSSQDNASYGFTFNTDGTKMYFVGGTNDNVHQYTLSTAWDVSTATYTSLSKDVLAQDQYPHGIIFNPDGTKMYMLGWGSRIVYQYTLNGAWDVSTANANIVKTITSNGKALGSDLIFNSLYGKWQLQDALATGATKIITLTTGTFDANGKDVTTGLFASTNSNVRTLTKGSGIWNLTGTGTVWDTTTTTNLTLNDTGTIKLINNSASAKTFAGGGKTFYNFWNATQGTGKVTIADSNTFNSFQINAGRTQRFTAGTTTTVNAFNATGTAGNLITLESTATSPFTLAKAGGGKISADYISVSYSTATPDTNTWYAGTNSTNGGNNSGWIFLTVAPDVTVSGDVKISGDAQFR